MVARSSLVCALFALVGVVAGQDDDPFDCHIKTGDLNYNLTPLAGEHSISRERSTPPSTMVDIVRFDLCADLKPQEGAAEKDQCPQGTRACLTTINKKDDHNDRVVSVIPLAQSANLDPKYSAISPSQDSKGLSLILHGSSYPSSASESTPQSISLTLICSTSAADPVFGSYEGGVLNIEWSAPAGCAISPSDDEDKPGSGQDDDAKENVGSGIGWFFLVLLLAFASYFGIGAYYNYSTYGATGTDLIPHRDFWREVPYMLRDVFDHLCTSVKPRSSGSRGGYIAV